MLYKYKCYTATSWHWAQLGLPTRNNLCNCPQGPQMPCVFLGHDVQLQATLHFLHQMQDWRHNKSRHFGKQVWSDLQFVPGSDLHALGRKFRKQDMVIGTRNCWWVGKTLVKMKWKQMKWHDMTWNEYMNDWVTEWLNDWVTESITQSINQWRNKWTHEWIKEWRNEGMNES